MIDWMIDTIDAMVGVLERFGLVVVDYTADDTWPGPDDFPKH